MSKIKLFFAPLFVAVLAAVFALSPTTTTAAADSCTPVKQAQIDSTAMNIARLQFALIEMASSIDVDLSDMWIDGDFLDIQSAAKKLRPYATSQNDDFLAGMEVAQFYSSVAEIKMRKRQGNVAIQAIKDAIVGGCDIANIGKAREDALNDADAIRSRFLEFIDELKEAKQETQ